MRKVKREDKFDLRYWPPIQGPGDDLFYTDLEECIRKENMNKENIDNYNKIKD